MEILLLMGIPIHKLKLEGVSNKAGPFFHLLGSPRIVWRNSCKQVLHRIGGNAMHSRAAGIATLLLLKSVDVGTMLAQLELKADK